MYEKTPIVTIVTVVFNAVETIEKTFLSIKQFKQQYDFEYIVIDGGSFDGTIEVIKNYSSIIDHWVSEMDNGIYDAMNKAINYSNGSWIYFINNGDTLLGLPIAILKSVNNNFDIVTGNVLLTDGELYRPSDGSLLYLKNTWHHQGTFYRKTSDILYNPIYKVYADYDLNIRLYKKNIKVLVIEDVIAKHTNGGLTSQSIYNTELKKIYFLHYTFLHYIMNLLYRKYRSILNKFSIICRSLR